VCDLPDVITVIEKNCANAATATSLNDLSVPASWDGSCQGTANAPGGKFCGGLSCNTAVKAATPTLLSGTCAASGGEPTLADVTWAIQGTACGDAPQGGGCDAGQVCQPTPTAPFKTGLCISRDGDQDCPGPPFTDKHLLFEKLDDTRGCSACTCGGSAGGSCSANITIYSDMACSADAVTFGAGTCAPISGNKAVAGMVAGNIAINKGTCPASGGAPMGDAVPSQPTTFCCVP
jgi:hypothetical protein